MTRRTRMTAWFLLMAFAIEPVVAQDRPAGPLHKTRSAVVARNGMAATSQPLATLAALRVMQQGGNAVDAAIAANAVLGVVEPMSCGMGGDLFAIVWDDKSRKLYGLNASGRSPYAATRELFRAKKLASIPTHGPLSWSVPGCVDGWDRLRTQFGTKPLAELLAPAIEYAETGFPVTEIIAHDWHEAAGELAKVPSSARCFLPGGSSPGVGDVFRNPDLARSLRMVAEGGPAAFYRGPIADSIVAYSGSVGGLFSKRDFADHASTWVEPVSTNYRGYDVWELPPNGQGIAALQMLNLLEPFDLKKMGPLSADALHLMIEAKKLAYEDRARFYADPDFVKIPVARLISKEYAATRAPMIRPDRANARPTAGEPGEADTIYMTVVDKDRNAVSLIQSNFHGFGSYHVPSGLGFPIQNRGCLFALDEAHANRLEPHKRPFHTIIPAFVTKDGRPWLSFGLMGGDMQAQGHAQVICNMIDFGMDVQEAGDLARFRHSGSSEPTGVPADGVGRVALESGVGPEARASLVARGHRIVDAPGGFGGYQAIRIDLDRGVLIGGSDPRKDGCAIGYQPLIPVERVSVPVSSIRFDSIRFDSIRFDSIRFDSVRFGSIKYGGHGGPPYWDGWIKHVLIGRSASMKNLATIVTLSLLSVLPPTTLFGQGLTYANARDYAKWEKEVAAYETSDLTSPPPKGGILFIGSSTIRLWKTLADDFPDHKVINRGFGGTEIVDSTHFADRLIFPHAPKQIFLRAGGNDIHNGRTPKQVAADFAEFVRVVHARLPGTEILYIPVSPAPARWGESEKYRELNRLIRLMALEMPRVGVVDSDDISLAPDGKARPELFVKDRLHFSPEGYKLLVERVRPFLAQ